MDSLKMNLVDACLVRKLKKNNSSMMLESSCSEVESLKDEISLPQENFHFLRSGLSSQGLTVRPRLDSPDRGKWKFSQGK